MAGIFISYRRSDSAYALLFYKALTERFGRDRVFRDFEDIEGGQDVVLVLDAALAQSAVCLVIIGKGWLGAAERLSNEQDFVRREIAAVLSRDTLVIPCLVGGAKMPTAVPDVVAALLRRDAMTVGDEYFDRDAGILLDRIDEALARAPALPAAPSDRAGYREQRAVELLKRLVSRLQIRAKELIQAQEIDRALDELGEGFDVIMQLLEWSPGDVPLDLQLGHLYKTLGQALRFSARREDADRYLDLAVPLFNRVGNTANTASISAADKASAQKGIGNIYADRGDSTSAIRHYRLALELAPDYAYAWHDLFAALLQQANAGNADVPAMTDALTQLKATATGTGLPGLGAVYLLQLEGIVRKWTDRD